MKIIFLPICNFVFRRVLLFTRILVDSDCADLVFSSSRQPSLKCTLRFLVYEQFIYYSFCSIVGFDVVSLHLSILVVVIKCVLQQRTQTNTYTKLSHSKTIVPGWMLVAIPYRSIHVLD